MRKPVRSPKGGEFNPLEQIPESAGMYANQEITRPQEIMSDAVEHLQGRQRQVYIMAMRENLSFSEIAKTLRISKSAVQIYRQRAISFITQFCKDAIKREKI
jgi:RNA polymerase sigma factor (sigma-70 family)